MLAPPTCFDQARSCQPSSSDSTSLNRSLLRYARPSSGGRRRPTVVLPLAGAPVITSTIGVSSTRSGRGGAAVLCTLAAAEVPQQVVELYRADRAVESIGDQLHRV